MIIYYSATSTTVDERDVRFNASHGGKAALTKESNNLLVAEQAKVESSLRNQESQDWESLVLKIVGVAGGPTNGKELRLLIESTLAWWQSRCLGSGGSNGRTCKPMEIDDGGGGGGSNGSGGGGGGDGGDGGDGSLGGGGGGRGDGGGTDMEVDGDDHGSEESAHDDIENNYHTEYHVLKPQSEAQQLL